MKYNVRSLAGWMGKTVVIACLPVLLRAQDTEGVCAASAAALAVRTAQDPAQATIRWVLLRDATHPGGPGRWVRQLGRASAAADCFAPVIRGGERITIEENSPAAHGQFEALALEPARIGQCFRARLRPGSASIRVIALGPGRAQMLAPEEVWP